MSTDTLEGKAAIDLWKQGKAAWNQWVKKNPEANIYFSRVDFGQYRHDHDCRIPAHEWPFAEFQFPKGKVAFSEAQFGEGDVFFHDAQFEKGLVSFQGTQFGEGKVSFIRAQFGEGNVFFNKAQFGEGDVSFVSTRIQGDFSLSHAILGEGTYDFERCDFERRPSSIAFKAQSTLSPFPFAT